jgi:hypothetical protein
MELNLSHLMGYKCNTSGKLKDILYSHRYPSNLCRDLYTDRRTFVHVWMGIPISSSLPLRTIVLVRVYITLTVNRLDMPQDGTLVSASLY